MPAAIFNSNAVKVLKERLRLRSGTDIIANDTDDPTSVAKDAAIGSVYIRGGTGEVYVKQDAGSSTNWKKTPYIVSLTNSRALVSDSNGDITSSAVTSTELGYVSGVTSALQTQLDAKLDKSGGTMTGTLTLNADGSGSLDAVTKQQLDAAIDGVQRKQAVEVATTANITLSGEQTIDGVLTSASRVLVKDQTSQSENGIYLSDAGAWTRTSDANSAAELNHAIVSVQSGTASGDTAWEQTTNNPNVGVDNIVWAQAYGAGTYTADETSLTLSGSTFSIKAAGVSDSKVATGIDAAKLADGSVSNTEFQYINSLTSNAQTQIDSKLPTTITTTGDVIYSSSGTTASRLPIGSTGDVLTVSGGIPSWASPLESVVTKTTTYTATTSDDTILADTSGGTWTLTLYAASGNSGRKLKIIKTTSDTTALTIDGNGSETINGSTTTTINTQYETLTLQCDGSNWFIVDRKTDTEWVAYTPTFQGAGTATSVNFFSRRVGDTLHIHGKFTTGTVTASEARVNLGFNGGDGNVSADSTKMASLRNVGIWAAGATTATAVKVVLAEPSAAYVTFGVNVTTTPELSKLTGSGAWASSTTYTLKAEIPISGWKA